MRESVVDLSTLGINSLGDPTSLTFMSLDKFLCLVAQLCPLTWFYRFGPKMGPNGTNAGLFQIRFQYI